MNKKISLLSLTFLIINNLVGSGALMLPASLASYGKISIYAWILTSVGAICLAMVFAGLSSKFQSAGGPHVYVKNAMGDFFGMITAWTYWTLTWIGNAAILVTLNGYLSNAIGYKFSILESFSLSLTILATICYVNIRGVRESIYVQNVTFVFKFIIFVILPLYALAFGSFDNFNAVKSQDMSTLMPCVIACFWGFVGLECGTTPGEDVKNPNYTIPRATIIGTTLSAIIYILGSISMFSLIPQDVLSQSQSPYADAARSVFGGGFSSIISYMAVVGCIGSINGWMLVVGYIPMGASKDNLFPKIFGKLSKNNTPVGGLISSGICIGLLLMMTLQESLLKQFELIINLAVTSILEVYLLCLLSFYIIQKRNNELSLSNYLCLFVGGSIAIAALIFGTSLYMIFLSFLLTLSGLPIYYLKYKGK
jgi:basic amino acid/polyamine antiporter, APA family